MKINQQTGNKRRDILFGIVFLISTAILIWKVPYGFGLAWADEEYVLATGHRLLFGDGPFAHEWFPAQMQGFLLFPVLGALRAVLGGTTGILLAARYTHLVCWGAVTCILYAALREKPFAWAAAFLFYFQAPLAIMDFSYNTIGLAGFLLTLLIFLKGRPRLYWLAGLALAAAVLCTPTLAVWYLGYTAAVLVLRKKKEKALCLRPESWLRVTGAAAGLAMVFLGFVLVRSGGIQNILTGLAECMGDGVNRTPLYKLAGYPFFLVRYAGYLTVPGGLCILAALWDSRKGGARRKKLLLALTVLVCVLSAGVMAWRAANGIFSGGGEYGLFNLPPIVLGLICFIYTKNKDWPLFRVVFLNGCAYSFAIHYTSNLYIMAIVHGLCVSAVAALIFAGEFWQENRNREDLLSGLALAGCLLVLAGQLTCRVTRTVGSVRTADCTYIIQEGAARGLKMPGRLQEEWESCYQPAALLLEGAAPGDKVFFTGRVPVLYLEADREYSCYTSWNMDWARQLRYWEAYPEKLPDAACFYKEDISVEAFGETADLSQYTIQETETAWLLWRNK